MRFNSRFTNRVFACIHSVAALLFLVLSPLLHAASDHGHKPSALQVVMAPAEEADHLSITVTNRSDQPVTFLAWDTPFEADMLADVFDISVKTKGFLPTNRITYTGPLPRRGLPDESSWVTLEAGEELTRVINLPEYYPMAKAGNVSISYNQDLVLKQRNAKKTRFPMESVRSAGAAQSASLELFVPQAETEVQAKSVTMKLSPAPVQARVLPANFNSCSASQEATINRVFRESEVATDTVIAELSALSAEELATSPRYRTWFGQFNAARDRTFSNALTNMQNAFDEESMTFDCQCVLTNRNSLFGFIRRDQPFLINVCPLFFSIADEQVVTIVHELTHFNEIGPTDDFAYGPGPSQQLAATNPAAAVRNADSYGYFVDNNVPELPLTGSADGALVDNSSFEFEPLEIVDSRSGQLVQGGIDLYVVAGVTSIDLESISGDADLFVFTDSGLTRLICSSESSESLDSCTVNTPRALFIAVLGFTESSYVLSTTGPSLDQPVTALAPEELVTANVGRSGSDFYTVTGVQTIVLDSLTGDADLYVYGASDFDFQSLVCESFLDSNNTTRDLCRVPPDTTLYLRVFGFTDSEYNLLASQGTLQGNGVNQGIAAISSGETISALVEEGGVELYTVTGPGRLDLLSQTGDADLYVFADGQLDEAVCESELFSAESTLDSCEIESGEFVVAVLGFTASNFLLSMAASQEQPVPLAEDSSNGILDVEGQVYSSSALELFWDRQPEAIVAYQVVGTDGTNITQGGTSLFIDNLAPNTLFTFTVTAINVNGDETVSGNIDLRTPGGDDSAVTVGVAVENLRGEVYSSSAVEIFWDVNNAPAGINFDIFRNDTLVGTTDGRSFFEDDLSDGTVITYLVVPQTSGASATVTLTLSGGVADVSDVPDGLDANGLVYSASALELFWQPVDGATTYRIERDSEILDQRSGLSFFDSGLASATEFSYLVVAMSSDGSVLATDSIVLTTREF